MLLVFKRPDMVLVIRWLRDVLRSTVMAITIYSRHKLWWYFMLVSEVLNTGR